MFNKGVLFWRINTPFIVHKMHIICKTRTQCFSGLQHIWIFILKKLRIFLKKCLTNHTGSCIIMKCFAIATNTKQDLRYGLLVKWLRRRPLTAKTGVRLPYKLFCVIIDSKEWTLCPLFRFCNIIIVWLMQNENWILLKERGSNG